MPVMDHAHSMQPAEIAGLYCLECGHWMSDGFHEACATGLCSYVRCRDCSDKERNDARLQSAL